MSESDEVIVNIPIIYYNNKITLEYAFAKFKIEMNMNKHKHRFKMFNIFNFYF